MALNTVSKICDDPQSVVDIYVNYDCGMTSANIFQSLIEQLAKMSGGAVSVTFVFLYSLVLIFELLVAN